MSEMIERVGEALRKECLDVFGTSWSNDVAWRLARAAIEAMREPTDDMKTCSDEIHWNYGCHVCGGLTEGWHKMVDAALGKVDA